MKKILIFIKQYKMWIGVALCLLIVNNFFFWRHIHRQIQKRTNPAITKLIKTNLNYCTNERKIEFCIEEIDSQINFIINKYYYISSIKIIDDDKLIKEWRDLKYNKRPVNSHIVINMNSDKNTNLPPKISILGFFQSLIDSATLSLYELFFSQDKWYFFKNYSLPRSFPAYFMFYIVWVLSVYINKREEEQRRNLKEARDKKAESDSTITQITSKLKSLKKQVEDGKENKSKISELTIELNNTKKGAKKLSKELTALEKKPKILTNNPYARMDKSSSDYTVFVDTSSLLESTSEVFFRHTISSLIKSNYFSPIFIVNDVIKELEKRSKMKSTSYNALKALNMIKSMKNKDLIVVLNDIGSFADLKFQTLLRERLFIQNICLITNDIKLADDILNIKKSKSVDYHFELRIGTIDRRGDGSKIYEYQLPKNNSDEKLIFTEFDQSY